jgi:hypothetical protein
MAKKKPTRVIQMPTSPETQIRTRARNLKIGKCYINEDWDDSREAIVIVTREHINGNLTVGFFLVDLAMQGIKEVTYWFNMPLREFEKIKDDSEFSETLTETDYNFAHNLIYGALEYGEDNGYKPHKDFAVAQYILEEDTEDIPLIGFEFGVNGKPMLFYNPDEDSDEDDFEVDPLIENGWDDDVDEMGVPTWGLEEWKEFLAKPKEEMSFRVFQYYIDQLFCLDHPEIEDLDAFEVVTGGLPIDIGAEMNIPAKEKEFLESVVKVGDKLNPGIIFNLAAEGVRMFPKSKVIHYMWLTYGFSASEEEGIRIYKECLKKFPDNLDFRNLYAEFLLEDERFDEMPGVYDHKEVLADFFPGKDKIDFRAAVGFCNNYCWYYTDKENLLKAEPFYQVLDTIVDTGINYVHKITIYRNVILKLHNGILKAEVE